MNKLIIISILFLVSSVCSYEKHYYDNCQTGNNQWSQCEYPTYLCDNNIPIFLNASSTVVTYCDYMEHVSLRIFSPYNTDFETTVSFIGTEFPIHQGNSTDHTTDIGKSLCIDQRCSVNITLRNYHNYPIELHQYVKQNGFWVNVTAIVYDCTPPFLYTMFFMAVFALFFFVCFVALCWKPRKRTTSDETAKLVV